MTTATTNHMSRYTAILADIRAAILDLQSLTTTPHPTGRPLPTAPTTHSSRYTPILDDIRGGLLALQFLPKKHKLPPLQMARFAAGPRHIRIIQDVAALARHSADLVLNSARA